MAIEWPSGSAILNAGAIFRESYIDLPAMFLPRFHSEITCELTPRDLLNESADLSRPDLIARSKSSRRGMDHQRYSLILAVAVLFANSAGSTLSLELELPIACEIGQTCFIQNYVDHDPSMGARDYMCRQQTYDKHDGTDFRLPSVAWKRTGGACGWAGLAHPRWHARGVCADNRS